MKKFNYEDFMKLTKPERRKVLEELDDLLQTDIKWKDLLKASKWDYQEILDELFSIGPCCKK